MPLREDGLRESVKAARWGPTIRTTMRSRGPQPTSRRTFLEPAGTKGLHFATPGRAVPEEPDWQDAGSVSSLSTYTTFGTTAARSLLQLRPLVDDQPRREGEACSFNKRPAASRR